MLISYLTFCSIFVLFYKTCAVAMHHVGVSVHRARGFTDDKALLTLESGFDMKIHAALLSVTWGFLSFFFCSKKLFNGL